MVQENKIMLYDFENSKWKEICIDILRPMFSGYMSLFSI